MIILSFKTYKESTGDNAVKLCQIVKKVIEKTKAKIIPAVQATDIYRIKKEVDIEVWAQHVDPIDPGRHMGWISPYALKQAGATGVIINHSEHKIEKKLIKITLDKAKKYDLKTILISHDFETAKEFDQYETDFLGYENEEFIASGVSLLTKEKEKISDVIKYLKHPVIIGAGISTKNDVKEAIKLGAKGVILASAFVLAQDPEKILLEMAEIFNS